MPRGGARQGAGRPLGAVVRATTKENRARLSDIARRHDEAAIKTLVRIATTSTSESAAAVAAACAIVDRGHGTPAQSLEHTGKHGGPIETREVSDADRIKALAVFLAKTREPAKVSQCREP